jgi:hypothetical protein
MPDGSRYVTAGKTHGGMALAGIAAGKLREYWRIAAPIAPD